MAKEDFCFTYYDGDAARDKAHMNRLERGAYDDIISAQRKFGHLTKKIIEKILSSDFEKCWEAIELILKVDADGKYFIDWLEISIKKSKEHSEHQRKNAEIRWEKYRNAKNKIGNATALPLEDGDGNGDGNGNEKGKEKEKEKKVETETEPENFEVWTEEILTGKDFHFEQLLMKEPMIITSEQLIRGHEAKCIRENSKFRSKNQFHKSLLSYLRTATENPKNQKTINEHNAKDFKSKTGLSINNPFFRQFVEKQSDVVAKKNE